MTLIPGPNSSGVDGKIFHKLVFRIYLSAAPLSLFLWVMYLVLATPNSPFPAATPSSRGGFCLVSFCQEQDTDSSDVEPHSWVESNSFRDLVSSLCTCLCSSISQARVSLLSEVNRAAAWLITRGLMVLRLQGSFLWI
jgi:hypothetical protein